MEGGGLGRNRQMNRKPPGASGRAPAKHVDEYEREAAAKRKAAAQALSVRLSPSVSSTSGEALALREDLGASRLQGIYSV